MVVIHIKNNENDSFLYETSNTRNGNDVIKDIVTIWNLRLRLGQLCGSVRDLGKYGPMKASDKVGIDSIQEEHNGIKIDKGEFYEMDPTGMRTGNGVGPRLQTTFETVISDAESILSKVRHNASKLQK